TIYDLVIYDLHRRSSSTKCLQIVDPQIVDPQIVDRRFFYSSREASSKQSPTAVISAAMFGVDGITSGVTPLARSASAQTGPTAPTRTSRFKQVVSASTSPR